MAAAGRKRQRWGSEPTAANPAAFPATHVTAFSSTHNPRPKVALQAVLAKLQGAVPQFGGGPGGAEVPGLAPRMLRRMYVGGLTPGVTETAIKAGLGEAMKTLNFLPDSHGGPVLSVERKPTNPFAFAEFTTPDAATAAMSLTGSTIAGCLIRVQRPREFNEAMGAPTGGSQGVQRDKGVPDVMGITGGDPQAAAAAAVQCTHTALGFTVAGPRAPVLPSGLPPNLDGIPRLVPDGPELRLGASRVLVIANCMSEAEASDPARVEELAAAIAAEVEAVLAAETAQLLCDREERSARDPAGEGDDEGGRQPVEDKDLGTTDHDTKGNGKVDLGSTDHDTKGQDEEDLGATDHGKTGQDEEGHDSKGPAGELSEAGAQGQGGRAEADSSEGGGGGPGSKRGRRARRPRGFGFGRLLSHKAPHAGRGRMPVPPPPSPGVPGQEDSLRPTDGGAGGAALPPGAARPVEETDASKRAAEEAASKAGTMIRTQQVGAGGGEQPRDLVGTLLGGPLVRQRWPHPEVPGAGRVYLELDRAETAVRVADALAGRSFNGRILVGSFLGERAYESEHFWGWGYAYGSGAEGVGAEAARTAPVVAAAPADTTQPPTPAQPRAAPSTAAVPDLATPGGADDGDDDDEDMSTDGDSSDDGVQVAQPVNVAGMELDDVM